MLVKRRGRAVRPPDSDWRNLDFLGSLYLEARDGEEHYLDVPVYGVLP